MSLNHQGQVLHNGQCMFSYYSIAVTMYGRIEISGRYSTSSKESYSGLSALLQAYLKATKILRPKMTPNLRRA